MPEYVGKPLVRMEDPFTLFSWAVGRLYSLWVRATYPFDSVGKNLFIDHTTILNRRLAPGIRIGNSVIFRNHAWVNTFDLSGVKGDVKIIIDDYCVINAQCVISAKNKIHLEPHVMVSACALIMDHNHAYEDINVPIQAQGLTPGGTIRIEEGCWIGHGAAIVASQGELVLGRNCVVAANALVTRSFPPYSVIVGNPARLARQFDPAKGIWTGGANRPASVSEPG